MFSMKSTWKEIKTTKPVDTALGDLFPTCWSILLQGHEEETMEQIHDRVHMEWGEAFWSQPLVNCANMLMETAEKQKLQICITKISTFLILCDLAVCLATLYVSFSLVFALMRYLQGKVFLIRFYSPTTLSSSRAEFRLPSRLACA